MKNYTVYFEVGVSFDYEDDELPPVEELRDFLLDHANDYIQKISHKQLLEELTSTDVFDGDGSEV